MVVSRCRTSKRGRGPGWHRCGVGAWWVRVYEREAECVWLVCGQVVEWTRTLSFLGEVRVDEILDEIKINETGGSRVIYL